ncbi:MAG: PQQ-like beta-propeller repeat protein [Pirellulales bacterium]
MSRFVAVGFALLVLIRPSYAVDPPATFPPDLGTRPTGEDWPGFLGPRGDGKSAETGLDPDWKKSPPKLLWLRKLGTSYGMPSIARGRLILCERIGDKARTVCLNSETGKLLWTYEDETAYSDTLGYDNGPRCAPVIDGDRVYTFGADGVLTCLNVIDGKKLWRVDTEKEFHVVQNFFGVGATPVVFGDLLIVQVGGSPAGTSVPAPDRLDAATPDGCCVVAFDKTTGKERYRVGDDLASYAGPTLARIDGKPTCFVFSRSGLLSFDPAAGKQRFFYPWRADDLYSVNAANPVVVGDEVLVSECYGPGASLLKAKGNEYEVLWKDKPGGIRTPKSLQTHWNTPVHHDGYVYGSSGRHSNNAELRCVEWKTGKVMWSQKGLSRSSLTYLDGHFLTLTEYGDLIVVKADSTKYEPVSTFAANDKNTGERFLEYPAWAAPIVSHGLLYVRGKDRLACYEIIPETKAK